MGTHSYRKLKSDRYVIGIETSERYSIAISVLILFALCSL